MRRDVSHAPVHDVQNPRFLHEYATTNESPQPASKVSEAVLEDAAASVRLELLDDEVRQAAGLFGSLEEGRPVLLDEPVQQRLVGPASLVAVSTRSRRAR
jgi:hypothetical protein